MDKTGGSEELEYYLSQLDLAKLEELYSEFCDFEHAPVSINEFLDSDKYLGNYFQGGLFPHWRKVLNEIYPSPHYSPYWLINFRGSIGAGKTSIVCAGLVYDLYRLLCMKSPQRNLGVLPQSIIVFSIFNVTMTLATDVIWGKLSQMFTSSPFFSALLGKLGTRPKDRITLFPKNITFSNSSRITHTLGKDVYSAIMSEANFEILGGQVYDTFNSLIRRMESRFMRPGGGIPGKIWLDSSETDKFSVVNKIVDQYRSKPGIFISQEPIWNVVTQRNNQPIYSGKRFWVYCGSDLKQPFIVESSQDKILQDEPEQCLEVPVEHRDAFEGDIHASLRDLAGKPTVANYKLYRLKDRLNRGLSVSPLFPDTFQLDMDDNSDQISNYCLVPNYFSAPLQPHIPRNIHIDIGISGDRLGIAATYVSKFEDRTIRDNLTFEEVSENVPRVITEWAFGLEPRPGKQIPLWKVRLFLLYLSKLGYPIGKTTFDGFQSSDSCQLMIKEGFDCEIVSVDRTMDAHMVTRTLIYEGRQMVPGNKILKRELEELEVSSDGQKIDHPEKNMDGTKGSKDIADAVAGSTFVTVRDAHKTKLLHLIDNKPKNTGFGEDLKKILWPSSV